jgi:hypothetical protein
LRTNQPNNNGYDHRDIFANDHPYILVHPYHHSHNYGDFYIHFFWDNNSDNDCNLHH